MSSTDLLEIPPFVKDEMRKHLAFIRLIEAAQALLADETETAIASHKPPGMDWSDRLWRMEDADHAKLCIELRRALKEAVRLTGFHRVIVPNRDACEECGGDRGRFHFFGCSRKKVTVSNPDSKQGD